MSSDRNPADQFALTILIATILALVAAFCSQCAHKPLEPEPRQPTAERLAELMAPSGRPVAPGITDVQITTQPAVALPGMALRLRCLIPDSPERGVWRLELVGVQASEGELPGAIEHALLVEHVPCPPLVASCTVARAGRQTISRTLTIPTPEGVCDGDAR